MSHTNATTNYALSQFISTDTPAWMTDVNGDNQKIDTALYNNAQAASQNATDIAGVQSTLTNYLPATGTTGDFLKRTNTGATWDSLEASEVSFDPTGTVLPSTVTDVQDAITYLGANEIIIREVRTTTLSWSAGTPGTHAGQCEGTIETVSGYSPVLAIVDGLASSVSCIIGAPIMEPDKVKCPIYRANTAAGQEWLNIRVVYKKV